MMKKTMNKLMAFLMALMLCLSLADLPVAAAFAEDLNPQDNAAEQIGQDDEFLSDTGEDAASDEQAVSEEADASEEEDVQEETADEQAQSEEQASEDDASVTAMASPGTVTFDKIDVHESTDNEMSFVAYVSKVECADGIKQMRFAVWSDAKGQDDIKWYTDQTADKGTYAVRVQIKNHKSPGLYQVHTYAQLTDGTLKYLGKTTFNVTAPTGNLTINNVSGQLGRFGMIGSGLKAPSGITRVDFAAWRDSDQNDLHWYKGVKRKEDAYSVFAQVENHKRHWGTYNVHVYVTMGNGIKACVGRKTVKISPDNYIYFTKLKADNSRYAITILNANVNGAKGSKVQFPVWSNTGGQDDIRWYTAKNIGANHFQVSVDGLYHEHGGVFNVHTYVDGKKVRSDKFNMSLDRNRSRLLVHANGMSSPTGWLILVDKATHRAAIFRGSKGNWTMVKYWLCGDGRPVTPTPVGVFRVGSKGYYFDSGPEFRCFYYTQITGSYFFHSILCHHNGVPFGGRQLGAGVSHGCVRLQKENALWLQNNVPTGSTIYIYV